MAQFPQALGFTLPKVKVARSAEGRKKDDAEVAINSADSNVTTVAAENDAETPAPETVVSLEATAAATATRDSEFARVIGLDFLLEDVVGKTHALDFESFQTNDRLQPLHVVVRLSLRHVQYGDVESSHRPSLCTLKYRLLIARMKVVFSGARQERLGLHDDGVCLLAASLRRTNNARSVT